MDTERKTVTKAETDLTQRREEAQRDAENAKSWEKMDTDYHGFHRRKQSEPRIRKMGSEKFARLAQISRDSRERSQRSQNRGLGELEFLL